MTVDPISSSNCPEVNVSTAPGKITVSNHQSGTADPQVKIYTTGYYLVYDCWDCDDSKDFSVGVGNYYVIVDFHNDSNCTESFIDTVSVSSSSRIYVDNTNNPIISINAPKIEATNPSLSTFTIMPNPARGNISVALESEIEKQQVLRVYNMQGAVILQKEVVLNKGANRVEFDIANIPSGTYTLVSIGERTLGSSTRFVKL